MRIFLYKVFFVTLLIVPISISETRAQNKTNYLESLFKEVETREKDPSHSVPRLYDKLIDNSIAFKLLDKYPNLMVGKINFVSRLPKGLIGKRKDIERGQNLIIDEIITPEMQKKPVTFQGLIKHIDLAFQDSDSQLSDEDWVLIASAFRTLGSPDTKNKPNALGIFVAEYIILLLINDLEVKSDRSKEDDELLSSLYFILSEIYQTIANNPQDYHLVQKKKGKKSSPMYFAFPKPYLSGVGYGPLEPITEITIIDYGIPYPDPYGYSVLTGFDVTFDILYGRRLDLLGTAVILTPYYDLAWVGIIDFIVIGIRVPFYRNRLSPIFWDGYFPQGVIGIQPLFIDRLNGRWNGILGNQALISGIPESAIISQSLRQMTGPEWIAAAEAQQVAGLEVQQLREQGALQLNQRELAATKAERRLGGLEQIQPEAREAARAQAREEREAAREQRRLEGRERALPEASEQRRLEREQQRLERRERVLPEAREQRRLEREQQRLERDARRLGREQQRLQGMERELERKERVLPEARQQQRLEREKRQVERKERAVEREQRALEGKQRGLEREQRRVERSEQMRPQIRKGGPRSEVKQAPQPQTRPSPQQHVRQAPQPQRAPQQQVAPQPKAQPAPKQRATPQAQPTTPQPQEQPAPKSQGQQSQGKGPKKDKQ